MFEPIGSGGLGGCVPDTIDCSNIGRRSGSNDNCSKVGNDQLIVGVHYTANRVVRLFGAQAGMQIED